MNRRNFLNLLGALIAAPLAFIRWHWGAWRHGTTSITVDDIDDMALLTENDVLLFDEGYNCASGEPSFECMRVTSVEGKTLTVARGTNGSTTRHHPAGSSARVFRGHDENGPAEIVSDRRVELPFSIDRIDKRIDVV